GSDLHSLNATYAVQLSAHAEFTAYAGVMRAENRFAASAAGDPAIARLFGVAPGKSVHGVSYLPDINLRLSEAFRNGVIFVGGSRTATPGNGLFLTSYSTIVTGGYTFT